MGRKKKRLKRILLRIGLTVALLAAAAGFIHYQTHDWFDAGPFSATPLEAASLPDAAADQMDLYRFGKKRYTLSAWHDADKTVFTLQNPGGDFLWARATQPGTGALTFPYSREQMSWWGWRIPLADGNEGGMLFISPLGNLRYYYFGGRYNLTR